VNQRNAIDNSPPHPYVLVNPTTSINIIFSPIHMADVSMQLYL